MPKPALDYDLLAIFIAVAETKSFSKAAVRCGIGKGTVSRAIVALEQLLGAQLIHRNTHAVALSTAGTALYERTAKPLRDLDEAIGHLPEPGERPSGLLRLATAPSLGSVVLPEVLAQFTLRYPEISFELLITNAVVDIVAQGFDLAIQVVPAGLKSSALTVRRLGTVNGGFYAAPSYLARRGRPKTVSADHEWVLDPSCIRYWKLPRDRIRFVCDDFVVMRELASEGIGVTFLPHFCAATYVRSGKLEHVSTVVPGRSSAVPLVMLHSSKGPVSRRVKAFGDFVVEWLKGSPLG